MLPTTKKVLARIEAEPRYSTRELAREFAIPKPDFEAFAESLFDLQRSGDIVRVPGAGWEAVETSRGTSLYRFGFISINDRVQGFVRVAGDGDEELFVRPQSLGAAVPGDGVVVKLVRGGPSRQSSNRLREAYVVEVCERRRSLVRGRFSKGRSRGAGGGWVTVVERGGWPDIVIPPGEDGGARDGARVLVRLSEHGASSGQDGKRKGGKRAQDGRGRGEPPPVEGTVVVAVKKEGSYDDDVSVLCRGVRPARSISAAVTKASDALKPLDLRSGDDGRLDLRELQIFTIDPEDAKDFDDAISLEDLGGGQMRLGVHIADVSHFVRPDSVIDREAAKRTTSVYLPGHVIPMLPERLCNELCSLRPDEDHPAKTVFLTVDRRGVVLKTTSIAV